MNRFVQSRAVLVLLMILLQVSFLPGQGRLHCMARMDASCCCSAPTGFGAKQPETTRSCCERAAAGATEQSEDALSPAPDRTRERHCTCGDTHDDPALPVEVDDRGNPPFGTEQRHLPARNTSHAHEVARRTIPRARTGPPLFVRNQVFLI